MKKKIYIFALITILLCHHYAFAADTSVITSVVLYPGNATIERTVKVAAGTHRLELSGLPANFDLQSVRVEVGPRIHVGEVSVHDVGHAQAIGGREAEIEAKIRALADQKAVLDIDAKSAELVRDYLGRLGGTPVDSGNKLQSAAVDPQSLAAVIEIISRSGRDAFGRLQRVEAQKRELDKQIQALERDLKRIRSGAKDVRNIVINVVAQGAGDIRVSYQVRGPGWRPTYRAALDSATSRVELVRQAVITQTTGEDWKDVKLKLSTTQPRLSPQGPEPNPWTLSVRPRCQASLRGASRRVECPGRSNACGRGTAKHLCNGVRSAWDDRCSFRWAAVDGIAVQGSDGRQAARPSRAESRHDRVCHSRDRAARGYLVSREHPALSGRTLCRQH